MKSKDRIQLLNKAHRLIELLEKHMADKNESDRFAVSELHKALKRFTSIEPSDESPEEAPETQEAVELPLLRSKETNVELPVEPETEDIDVSSKTSQLEARIETLRNKIATQDEKIAQAEQEGGKKGSLGQLRAWRTKWVKEIERLEEQL